MKKISAKSGAIFTVLTLAGVTFAPAQDRETAPDHVDVFLTASHLDRAALASTVSGGEEVIPRLLSVIESGGTNPLARGQASRALRALRLMGPEVGDAVVPALLRCVSSNVRHDDAELLQTLATLAPGVHEKQSLDANLDSNPFETPANFHIRDRAGFLLWIEKMKLWYRFRLRLTHSPSLEVGKLVDDLQAEDPLFRQLAAEELGLLGPNARPAIEALVAAEKQERHPRITRCSNGSLTADFHGMVRDAAAIAIARVDPTHPNAQRGLELLVRRADDPQERSRAVLALGHLRKETALPTLLRALEDEDASLVADAATAIGMTGISRDDVITSLKILLDSRHRRVAVCAEAALRSLR